MFCGACRYCSSASGKDACSTPCDFSCDLNIELQLECFAFIEPQPVPPPLSRAP
jgi:hypothetical protein